MKYMPKIGLTTLLQKRNSHAGDWYVRPDRYDRAVVQAGAIPVSIPAFASKRLCEAYLENIDGMLFIGGPDLPPSFYTEEPVHPSVHPLPKAVSNNHLYLVKRSLEKGIPVLGICLGMQELYVADGGKLIQHIGELESMHKKTGGDQYHTVTLEPGSRLESIFGCREIRVNSAHHQAGNPLFSPEHAKITAFCGDTVEAIEFPGGVFRIGVQWHPERIDDREHRNRLFSAFIGACRKEKLTQH